jgi:hypothetical protein
MTSIFIPFTYKFGQMGLVYGLGAGVLLSTVFFLIAGLGLRINLLDRTIGRFFESLESGLISNLFKNFSAIFSSSYAGLISTLLILLIMLLVMFISFKISLFIYCRKDL